MMKSFEIEDGAHEVVDERPLRSRRPVREAQSYADEAPGGKLRAMQEAAHQSNRRFILLRGPQGAVKFALAHVPTFRAVWRLWMAKRVSGQPDPGVTMADLEGAGQGPPRHIMASLVKNGALTRTTTYTGFQGALARYYPTSFGHDLVAAAELFGMGVHLQVGGMTNAWKGRNLSEPSTIFQCAALIGRGLEPEIA